MAWHLAQLNIAKMKAPIDDPLLADFVAALEPVNAAADASPGFVWRLQEDGDSTSIRVFDDDTLLVNLSVWKDLDSLKAFFASGLHAAVMRRRGEWFDRMEEAYAVLWWVRAGDVPTVAEAERRLERLRTAGPGVEAFSFAQPFPPPVD